MFKHYLHNICVVVGRIMLCGKFISYDFTRALFKFCINLNTLGLGRLIYIHLQG